MYIDVYFEKDEKEPERIVINGKHCYHVKGMADVHNLFIHLFGGYTDIPYNLFIANREQFFSDGLFVHTCQIYDIPYTKHILSHEETS